jgi:hypothetical protein
LHIQNSHGLADDHWQIQLHSPLDLLLFALRDVRSDRLRGAFYRFGGDLQAGQGLHLLATVTEGGRSPNYRQHATHARRQFLSAMSNSRSTGNCP